MQKFFTRLIIALLTCLLGMGAYVGWAAYRLRSEVLRAMNEFNEASLRRDVKSLDSMLAENFVINNPKGEIDKSQMLSGIRRGEMEPSPLIADDIQVGIFSDRATAGGDIKEKFAVDAAEGRPQRFTCSFEKRQGRWLLVSISAGK